VSVEPRSPLEQILFAAETGMTPDAIRAWWPPDTPWRERENSILAPSAAIAPFGYLEYKLMAGVLYNVKLVVSRQGDYAAFAELEAELRAQFPSIAAWTDTLGRPFSLEAARPRLEGKGNARFMMAVPIGGDVLGVGVLSGKAVAFNRDGAQHYGFELFWRYGGYPA
jgi:hypothetical protein